MAKVTVALHLNEVPEKRGIPEYCESIKQALDSVLNQTYGDLKLIIIDDTPTGESENICRAAQKAEARIDYYRMSDPIHWSKAASLAISLNCASDYFSWISHRVRLEKIFLEKMVAAMEAEPASTVAAACRIRYTNREASLEYIFEPCFGPDIDAGGRYLKALQTPESALWLGGRLIRTEAMAEAANTLDLYFKTLGLDSIGLALNGPTVGIPEPLISMVLPDPSFSDFVERVDQMGYKLAEDGKYPYFALAFSFGNSLYKNKSLSLTEKNELFQATVKIMKTRYEKNIGLACQKIHKRLTQGVFSETALEGCPTQDAAKQYPHLSSFILHRIEGQMRVMEAQGLKYPDFYLDLAQILAAGGRREEALLNVRLALAAQPDNRAAQELKTRLEAEEVRS